MLQRKQSMCHRLPAVLISIRKHIEFEITYQVRKLCLPQESASDISVVHTHYSVVLLPRHILYMDTLFRLRHEESPEMDVNYRSSKQQPCW